MSTASELACKNCGVAHGPDDIFCENCGYDFITGSLPGPSEQFISGGEAPPEAPAASGFEPPAASLDQLPPPAVPDPPVMPTSGASAPPLTLRIEIGADLTYFQMVVAEGELSFPDPAPLSQVIELAGMELHIGRTSQSKAIHPDIDIAALTTDPAVSSRHAVLRVDNGGTVTVTDVGSTNGTYVGSVDSPPITHGEPVLVNIGTPIYLGAWTRLVLASPSNS